MKETTVKGFRDIASGVKQKYSDKTERVCVQDVMNFFKSEGFEIEGDFGTNGWDYDWWVGGVKQDVRITISGSGYYGGIQIFVSDED